MKAENDVGLADLGPVIRAHGTRVVAATNDDGARGSRPALTEPQLRLAAVLADVLLRDLRANPPPPR